MAYSKALDLIILSAFAFKSGKKKEAAGLFSEAMKERSLPTALVNMEKLNEADFEIPGTDDDSFDLMSMDHDGFDPDDVAFRWRDKEDSYPDKHGNGFVDDFFRPRTANDNGKENNVDDEFLEKAKVAIQKRDKEIAKLRKQLKKVTAATADGDTSDDSTLGINSLDDGDLSADTGDKYEAASANLDKFLKSLETASKEDENEEEDKEEASVTKEEARLAELKAAKRRANDRVLAATKKKK